ncbi:MAG: hypothetical protein WAW85_10320 [Gordonia sp. (in: high G+C Gram-positive bacteria)]|uniref:hypothetical protein n=1 Tax=Gordonia sp. (in: high G+C Gram-positive bacteria) TaxID=84139 RepID=UPI003BB4B4E5
MVEKILVGLIAVVAYPLMWLTNSIEWCAGKLRVPPFYIVVLIVLLPIWVTTLVEFVGSDDDVRSSYLDWIVIGVGGLLLAYILLVGLFGLLFVPNSGQVEDSEIDQGDEQ